VLIRAFEKAVPAPHERGDGREKKRVERMFTRPVLVQPHTCLERAEDAAGHEVVVCDWRKRLFIRSEEPLECGQEVF
jgi:hypothetical protein